jgi:hypothetical protein
MRNVFILALFEGAIGFMARDLEIVTGFLMLTMSR